jgi:hypothetical protein
MASNNFHANGTGDSTVVFGKAVCCLNVYVATGVTFAVSLDNGQHFMGLPAGFHSFPVSPVLSVMVQANGIWAMVGVQG